MKKLFRCLITLSLSASALSACSLEDIFGGGNTSDKPADHIDVRDYSTEATKGSKYEFDGKVFAVYEDETETEVTKKCTFTTLDTSTLGTSEFVVRYEDSKYIHKKTISIKIVKDSYVALQSISLPENLKVKQGSPKSISPTFVPSDASNKEVSFSIANTNIATVDSSGKITPKSLGETTLTVTSKENSSIKATTNLIVHNNAQDEWTILMYVCGANLESGTDDWGNVPDADEAAGLASADIDEILGVKNQPDDVNIVLQTGGANVWQSGHSYSINKTKLQRWEVNNKTLVNKDTLSTYTSMGNPSTLKSFLEWGIEEYPAEKYGLIFWDHGGGMSGCCFDERKGDDGLTHDEVVTAVSGAFSNKGVDKFEFVGYDCCLMQMMEIAEFNSPYFNYQVTSQELENGTGWAYDKWLDDLYGGASTETILKAIVDGFIEVNGGKDGTGYYYDHEYYACDQTLSVINLNKISAFMSAWENMAQATKAKISSSAKSSFKTNVINKTKVFAESVGAQRDYSEFDCYDFLLKLESESTFNPGSSYIDAAKNAFNDMITYNLAQLEGSADAHGLSCYFGNDGYNTSTYTHFTKWSSLVSYIGGY